MAIHLTQRANGASIAVITTALHTPTSHGHSTASRGWTKSKAARMRNKLMDVDTDALTHPHALTLTMTAAPSKPQQLTSIIKRLHDTLTAQHALEGWAWVVEFTGARVPHFHALATFRTSPDAEHIWRAWLHALATEDTSGTAANQHITRAYDPSGWLNYMSKTAGKGYDYYARPHIPEYWTHTGSLYSSTLPTAPPQRHKLTAEQFRTVRDDMDTHAHRTTGKQPPKFHDARDHVTGRTVWGYRYTGQRPQGVKKSVRIRQQKRRKRVVRPYLLKEGAAGQKKNRLNNFSLGRFAAESCQHSERTGTSEISPPPSLLTETAPNTPHGAPRLFIEFSPNKNTNLERTAKTDPPHHRGRSTRDTRGAPRPQNPHAPHQPAPPHSTRPAPRAPPPHVRAHPCARLRSHACRYSSCRPPAHAPDDSTPTTQGDAP